MNHWTFYTSWVFASSKLDIPSFVRKHGAWLAVACRGLPHGTSQLRVPTLLPASLRLQNGQGKWEVGPTLGRIGQTWYLMWDLIMNSWINNDRQSWGTREARRLDLDLAALDKWLVQPHRCVWKWAITAIRCPMIFRETRMNWCLYSLYYCGWLRNPHHQLVENGGWSHYL
jgi:hypothetical protein